MRGELAARDAVATAKPAAGRRAGKIRVEDSEPGYDTPLPELENLVARLPGEVRETLEELFRARFLNVKRLPKSAFQVVASKAPPKAESVA